MKIIFTIIVTYNGEQWILNCLNSVINSSFKTEIVIVDNGSFDKTVNLVKEKFPSVKIIENKINLGFGRANNLGLQYAIERNADYFFLLNQDAWIEFDTIEKLVNVLQSNTNFGILAPIRKVNNCEIEDNILRNIVDDGENNLLSDFILNNEVNDLYEISFIGAAAWLISYKCVKLVGGFDPIFFHYGEDNDYCKRVKMAKLQIGICPKIAIFHDKGLRSPDRTRSMRLRFAKLIFILRYKNISRIMFMYYYLQYFYYGIFYSDLVLNTKKLKFNLGLKTLRIEI